MTNLKSPFSVFKFLAAVICLYDWDPFEWMCAPPPDSNVDHSRFEDLLKEYPLVLDNDGTDAVDEKAAVVVAGTDGKIRCPHSVRVVNDDAARIFSLWAQVKEAKKCYEMNPPMQVCFTTLFSIFLRHLKKKITRGSKCDITS